MKSMCLLIPINMFFILAHASYFDECRKEISEEQIKVLLKYVGPDEWDLNKYANHIDNYIMSQKDSIDLDKPISINDFFTK